MRRRDVSELFLGVCGITRDDVCGLLGSGDDTDPQGTTGVNTRAPSGPQSPTEAMCKKKHTNHDDLYPSKKNYIQIQRY